MDLWIVVLGLNVVIYNIFKESLPKPTSLFRYYRYYYVDIIMYRVDQIDI